MVGDITAIDADGHIRERQDEIRPYLDDRFKGRTTRLWPEDQPWDSVIRGKLRPPCGYRRGLKAAEQVDIWHRILDEHDIAEAVLFPSGSGHAAKVQEPDFAAAVARAVNRHFASDFRTDRLHPMGVLPMRDPEAAAREVEHGAGLGLKGFEVLTDGLPFGLGNRFYDPVFEAAQRTGTTIAIHGTRHWGHDWGADKLETFAEVHAFSFPAGVILHFTSVLCQGVSVRFPDLRIGFMEIGATWLPYYLDRLDEHYEKRGAEEMPLLEAKPSDTFRASSYKVSIEGKESMLRETVDFVGPGHLVYATDLPHWDCEFPENLEDVRASNAINDAERRAILFDNAKALYAL